MNAAQTRIFQIAGLIVMASLLIGCGSAGAGPGPEGSDEPPNTTESAIQVSDQTLVNEAEVTIDAAELPVDGFVVVYDDAGGSPGTVIGQTSVTQGSNSAVQVTLDRFASDQETLHVGIHKDEPSDGTFTYDGVNGQDEPVDGSATEPIVVTVASADVRVSISNVGLTSYQWGSAEPASYGADFPQGSNPVITLETGLRYEFVNSAYPTHPLVFINQTREDTIANDVVLVGQDGVGTLAADPDVNLAEAGNSFRITIVEPLASSIQGYRNLVVSGRLNMRGTVNLR